MVQGRPSSTATIEDIVMDRQADQVLVETNRETVYKRWEMEEHDFHHPILFELQIDFSILDS